MRKIGISAVAVASLMLAAACGGAGSGSKAQTGSEDTDFGGDLSGSLQIIGFGVPDEIASVRVDVATEALEGVDVNVVDGDFDDQVFLSSVAANNPPEVVYMDASKIGSFAARGALMPLDECAAERDIDMSQYRETMADAVKFDGKSYGVPEFFNAPVLIVNNTALEEAGLTLDDVSVSDQDKLMNLAEKLTIEKDGKIERLGVSLRIPELMHTFGVIDENPWVASADDIRLDDPQTIATFERLKEVQDAQGGQPKIEDTIAAWDFWGEGNPFATNQLGVLVIEQWYVNVIADTSPDADITVLPITNTSGELATLATGSSWAIPAGSNNPAAACEWMKQMTAPDTWSQAAQARIDLRLEENKAFTGIYTANEKADDIVFGELYDGASADKKWDDAVQAIREAQDSAVVAPATAVGSQFKIAWEEAANSVLKGLTDAPTALKDAQNKVDAALQEVTNE